MGVPNFYDIAIFLGAHEMVHMRWWGHQFSHHFRGSQAKSKLVGGWTTHLENVLVKLDHVPKVRGKNQQCLKPPPKNHRFVNLKTQNRTFSFQRIMILSLPSRDPEIFGPPPSLRRLGRTSQPPKQQKNHGNFYLPQKCMIFSASKWTWRLFHVFKLYLVLLSFQGAKNCGSQLRFYGVHEMVTAAMARCFLVRIHSIHDLTP